MKTRKLGNSGLEVSALGMGAMNLSFGTGPAADKDYGISVIRYGVGNCSAPHWAESFLRPPRLVNGEDFG